MLPAKILMANSNLLFAANSAMQAEAERGCVRETFFVSQMTALYKTTVANKGDFKVANEYVFEVGGPGKGYEQIKNTPNAFVAADGIEVGFAQKIPLYLFGLLYIKELMKQIIQHLDKCFIELIGLIGPA